MIWIGDIPADVSNATLKKAFSMFGHVEKAVVVADPGGASLGYGYVIYDKKQAASTAIQRCSEMPLLLSSTCMRPVRVELMRQKEDVEGVSKYDDISESYTPGFPQQGWFLITLMCVITLYCIG